MECSLSGFSVNGIHQARILEWVAISSSRGSSQPRDWKPCLLHLLHWQEDSLPLSHMGSPRKHPPLRLDSSCLLLCAPDVHHSYSALPQSKETGTGGHLDSSSISSPQQCRLLGHTSGLSISEPVSSTALIQCPRLGTSLAVQWLTVCLAMHRGFRFDPWSGNQHPTSLETAKPMHCNYWVFRPNKRSCMMELSLDTAK